MSAGESRGETTSLDRVRGVYSFWGEHAGLYALQDYVTFLGRPRRIRGRAAAALGVGEGARVLEVGCGTGRNFPFILQHLGPSGRLVGFDYSEEMLSAACELCRRSGWRNVTLRQGDAACLDIGESGFDGAISVLALSAIPGWREALGRMHEKLAPGGRISICDAQLFPGRAAVLNPWVRSIYVRLAAWDPDRDLVGAVENLFGSVEVEFFNGGSFFVASATKREV